MIRYICDKCEKDKPCAMVDDGKECRFYGELIGELIARRCDQNKDLWEQVWDDTVQETEDGEESEQ